MIFFLNYDGTLTRQDTGRIFQGSTAVPEIKVLSGVSSASSVLEVAFTLPNGLVTQYFPLTQMGEYEQDGIKAFLWSLELATDILANVTEQVGKVGVSVRQVNVINNTVVASYTATFDVEYSALPYTPTEYTPADTQELIDLLGAYYNQNQTLIDSIRGDYESVVDRLDEQGEDITNLESDVDKLEELTDRPLLINITTDVETGVGTKYYNDGTTSTFEIGTDVATSQRGNFMTEIEFLSTSLNWTQESDGTYSIVFSPATTERNDANCIVAVDRLDGNGYNQTANGVLKGSDGSLALYGVATPFDGKLLVLAGGGAGTKIWTSSVRVGEEISGLSFDTASTPAVYSDFLLGGLNSTLIKVGEVKTTIIQNEERAEFTTQLGLVATNIDDPPQAELVWRTCEYKNIVLEQLTDDTIRVSVDGQLYYEGNINDGGSIDDIIVDTIVYRQYSDFHQNNGKPTGWLVDELTFDRKYTIEEVNNYDKWEEYIGVSDKSTLYDKALIGDYYIDEASGKWYLCVGKTDASIDWEYLFTSKVSVNLNGTQTSKPVFFAPTSTRNANSNGSCWVLTPNGYNAPEWEQMTLETADNLTYTIKIGGKNVGSFTLTKEVFLDSVSYNPETKKLTFTYNTESGKASVDIDLSDLEEVQNALIATNETEFTAYQTEENVGKLVTYRGLLYIITESTPTPNAPIAEGDTIDKLYFNTSVTPDFSQFSDGLNILVHASNSSGEALVVQKNLDVETGVINYLGGNFEEAQGIAYIELVSGEFDISEMGFTQWGWQTSEGTLYQEYGTPVVSEVNQQDLWGSYISKEPFASGGGGITAKLVNEINSITCDGTSFRFSYKVGENTTMDFFVPIDYVDAELVDTLSYNDLTDVPIVIGDLDAITPVANTYYKHNGADETTYTKGVIYFYDGSTFAPVTGGGGGVSDVQINGASIVADGVANIPYATASRVGLLSYSDQQIGGKKVFNNNIVINTVYSRGVQIGQDGSGASGAHLTFFSNTSNSQQVDYTFYCKGKSPGSSSSIRAVAFLLGKTVPEVQISTEGAMSGIVRYYFDKIVPSGYIMATPTTWSTGTSGSVTLPSAGLYEIKCVYSNNTHSFILNWDGATACQTGASPIGGEFLYAMVAQVPLGTVYLQTYNPETKVLSLKTIEFSYRKIGIA